MWIQFSPHWLEHGLGKVAHLQSQFKVVSTGLHHWSRETERWISDVGYRLEEISKLYIIQHKSTFVFECC